MAPRKRNKILRGIKKIIETPIVLMQRGIKRLLRGLYLMLNNPNSATRNAKTGFVLPTVIMVILVVVLLTTAIVIRSLDRAKNAGNFRVEQTLVNASTPALERAKAKIDNLLNNDKTLPRGTPSDVSIRDALKNARYTFGDETQLRLTYDGLSATASKIGITATSLGSATITSSQETVTKITDEEVVDTAWKFPYDSDNNGKFDSFTLYSIVYRNPPLNTSTSTLTYSRKRTALEARSLPSADALQGCGTSGAENSLVAGSDWLKTGGKYKKAFYIYVANVPITSLTLDTSRTLNSKYEVYTNNKSGFSGLEMSIEPSRIPLNNNAVWFDNDIEISYSADFYINGRIHTNGNLMVSGSSSTNKVHFYLVSSIDSCYYKEPENSKISVGGEMATGSVLDSADDGGTRIHLYKPGNTTCSDASTCGNATSSTGTFRGTQVIETTTSDPTIGKTTTETGGNTVGYNSKAYANRLGLLVDGAINLWSSSDTRIPSTVKAKAAERQTNGEDQLTARRKELESFFQERTRRVPYKEVVYQNTDSTSTLKVGSTTVSYVATPITSTDFIFSGTGEIRPPVEWMLPFKNDGSSNSTLADKFYTSGTTNLMYLQATDPDLINASTDKTDNVLGDRILVGNGLPKNWADYTSSPNTSQTSQYVKTSTNTDVKWLDASGNALTSKNRYRQSRIQFLDDLGDLSRGGFWEQAAAKVLQGDDNPGGLRIVTGAGIYVHTITSGTYNSSLLDLDTNSSFLPRPSTYYGTNILEGGVSLPALPTGLQATPGQLYTLVWSDQLPMSVPDNPSTSSVDESTLAPDLRMRATAVYHYRYSQGQTQEPLACVSSYYDPSTSLTAQNGKYNTSGSQVFPWNTAGASYLPDNPVSPRATGATPPPGRSNNGVVYPNPYGSSGRTAYLTAGVVNELKEQARFMFPNGRIVNQPLQDAMIKLTVNVTDPTTPIVEGVDTLNMANYSSVDAAVCALRILTDPTFQPVTTSLPIEVGTIKENAFLNGRQVKSVQQNITSGTYTNTQIEENRSDFNDRYNLPLEQKQPLEIRVTELDMNLLRQKAVTRVTGNAYNTTSYSAFSTPGYQQNDEEFLLPNSGVIYVARDDALMDLSAAPIGGSGTDNTYNPSTTQKLQSRSDLELDPTRRPNGVKIINGENLQRKDFYRYAEKGLILATDLPIYVEGNFNLHVNPADGTTVRNEFTSALLSDWTNFYKRNTSSTAADVLNPNFACVKGQTSTCTEGDRWRATTLLSDSTTLLTTNFREGFRNEGDFDLRNNIGNVVDTWSSTEKRRGFLKNGFWFNNYATSADWVNSTDGYPSKDLDPNTTGTQSFSSYVENAVTPIQRRVNDTSTSIQFPEYLMEYCPKIPISECTASDWVVAPGVTASSVVGQNFANGPDNNVATTTDNGVNYYRAGTTAIAPNTSFSRFPRRLAFRRTSSKRLILELWNSTAATPVPRPIGINSSGVITEFPYSTYGTTSPRPANNALWFMTTDSGNISSPTYNASTNIVYRTDRPLAFDLTSVSAGIETPEIPGLGVSLNAPSADPASGYLICTAGGGSVNGASKKIVVNSSNLPETGACPSATLAQARSFRDALLNTTTLNPASSTTDNIVRPLCSGDAGSGTPTNCWNIPRATRTTTGAIYTSNDAGAGDSSQPVVNVIELDGGAYPLGTTCSPITLTGNDNSIFVIRVTANSALKFPNNDDTTACGFQLVLNGVDANNVIWALNANMQFNSVSATNPHRIAGTFLMESTGNPDWKSLDMSNGGRMLGGNKVGNMTATTQIYAIATDGQPRPYPMLQIHNPIGKPNATVGNVFRGSFTTASSPWVQSVTPTVATYNAIFVTGDSPSAPGISVAGTSSTSSTRPVCPYAFSSGDCGEDNGSFNNFMRLLEYWRGSDNMGIQGSFIQARQSYYDSGPWTSADITELTATGTGSLSLFGYTVSSNQPTYLANNSDISSWARTGFRYPGGAGGGFASYYTPARRLWGYDVGLLSASPDLFSQRFTTPPTGSPNQSFRPVGRDDSWIQSLLCAAQAPSGTTKTGYDDARSSTSDILAAYGTNYTFAISQDQRPSQCPVCWGTSCP